MDKDKKHNILWWLKTAGEGLLWAGGYYGTDMLKLFPEHTVAHQIALPAGFILGYLARKIYGARKEYKKDALPEGITKALDKIPDKLTGIKGSNK